MGRCTILRLRCAPLRTGLHGDHLGSTNVVSGAAISKQTYYPFGMPRTTEGTLPTDYAFTGQRQDIYIKLIEMGSRWYDPELGRWTQPDSIIPNVYNPQSLNRFSYVLNNPLRYTDPTGHYNECGDDCSDEDKALSDNVPAIEIIEDTIRENLNQDFGVNTNKAFSVGQLRILETMLYDFANKAGSVNAARRAIHGVVFHNNAPGKGEYGTEQFGGLISLDNWVWQSDTAAAKRTLLHELAHYWDWAASDPLTQFFNLGIISFQMRIQVNEIGPTEYARSGPPRENWAESVEMFVYPDYASVLRGADSEKHNGVYVEPGLRPQTRDFVNSKFTELRRGLR